MNTDNPFGMEMDEDGLPKYSPDRKNITAYHMFKLGLTDKLPDPEERHTPFFRTPSYYEEKAERERRKEAGSIPKIEAEPVKPERRDFFKHTPVEPDSAFHPEPSIKPDPVTPGGSRHKGQGNWPDSPGSGTGMSGQDVGEAKPPAATFGHDAPYEGPDRHSSGASLWKKTMDNIKSAYLKQFQEDSLPKLPAFRFKMMGAPSFVQPLPMTAGKSSAQPRTAEIDREFMSHSPEAAIQNLLYVLPPSGEKAQGTQAGKPLSLSIKDPENGTMNAISPTSRIGDENEESDNATLRYLTQQYLQYQENKKRQTGQNRQENTNGQDSKLFEPLSPKADTSVNSPVAGETTAAFAGDGQSVSPENGNVLTGDTSLWTTGDTGAENDGQDGDFSPDELEAPSAGGGRKKGFESVFANDNAANPGFAPMQVAILSPGQLAIPKGRREVTLEMTNGINSELTRLNRGWALGINFTVLSRLEGGSSPYANLPIARGELDLERQLIEQDRKNGTNKAATMKWANRSGVTIGSGFDLGQTSIDEMRGMGFPESLIGKCAPYVGKKRVVADDALRKRPLILSHEEIDFVNRTVMMDKAKKSIQDWDSRIARLRKTIPDAPFFHEMTSAQQTIVFSRYYHQGSGWIDRTANKPMFEAMKKNDWATVKRQLEGLANRSGPKWLRDRFLKELWFLNRKD